MLVQSCRLVPTAPHWMRSIGSVAQTWSVLASQMHSLFAEQVELEAERRSQERTQALEPVDHMQSLSLQVAWVVKRSPQSRLHLPVSGLQSQKESRVWHSVWLVMMVHCLRQAESSERQAHILSALQEFRDPMVSQRGRQLPLVTSHMQSWSWSQGDWDL